MVDKTIIDITSVDAEKHAENVAKRASAYSKNLLHHASILSEKEYQKFLLERLEKDNGYVIRKASNFDRYFAVDREMLFKFLEDTQHETMEYLRKIYKADLEETIVSFINAEATKARGSLLDVLKHGIEISNQKLELMYTKPATTFNPDLTRKYGQNIFSAMEEVWASDKERIDVVIFLNGLAIIAFELKCNAAGQSYQDAIYQFRTDRSPKTRLFMFKAGTLVNFAMDLEEVYMTTKLAGDATFFLPFNMGNGEGITAGAGNPAFEDKYSVSYMWEDILTKDTILEDESRQNAHNTFEEMFRLGIIPVVNENDTVSTYEMHFGDNDTLSAIVSSLVGADLLILLSDIDGLYTDDPRKNPEAMLVECVEKMNEHYDSMAKQSTGSDVGTGGMATKLTAAHIATASGTDMIIANGKDVGIIHQIISGEFRGTLFRAQNDETFDIHSYLQEN